MCRRLTGRNTLGSPLRITSTTDGQRLPRDAAITRGEVLEGRILALLVASDGDEATVVFPGGEMTRARFDDVYEPKVPRCQGLFLVGCYRS
jgi:hypothetical protein